MLEDCRQVVCAGALKNAHLGPQEIQRPNIGLLEGTEKTENYESSLVNDYREKSKWLGHFQLFATPWTIQSIEFSRPEHWSE